MRITPDEAGCWLDGNQGWHNHYRVVDLAMAYGMTLDEEDQKAIDGYRDDRNDPDLDEAIIGQGGLVDQATDYLESLTPAGYHFEWDMGELSLRPCSEIEGHDPKECEE